MANFYLEHKRESQALDNKRQGLVNQLKKQKDIRNRLMGALEKMTRLNYGRLACALVVFHVCERGLPLANLVLNAF